jgi:hypothetical protein
MGPTPERATLCASFLRERKSGQITLILRRT